MILAWLTRHLHPCRHGHQWLLPREAREFLPVTNYCMRCSARETYPPTGMCLGNHPLAEHYDAVGNLIAIDHCRGPV